MEPEADGTRLGHVETGRRAHGLHELAVARVERGKPVARANQGVARGGVDEAELLEIPDLSVKRHVPELPKPAVVTTRTPTTTSLAEVIRPDVKAKKNKRGAS